jgi:hypothetical protein
MLERLLENINEKYVGLFHLFFAIFVSLYGILLKKSWLDYPYIFYTIIVLISWTFFNGECFLTYYIKKKANKNYIAGEESTDLKDMYLLLGSKNISYFIITFFTFVSAVSTYIVLKRNNYPSYIYYSLPSLSLLYTTSLRVSPINLHENKIFLFTQEIFKAYFILVILILIFFKLR